MGQANSSSIIVSQSNGIFRLGSIPRETFSSRTCIETILMILISLYPVDLQVLFDISFVILSCLKVIILSSY